MIKQEQIEQLDLRSERSIMIKQEQLEQLDLTPEPSIMIKQEQIDMTLTGQIDFVISDGQEKDFLALEEISVSSMSEPWRVADLRSALQNEYAIILTASCGDEPVGYAVGYFAADEAELPSIAVSKRMRRRGVGDALLQTLFSEVRARGAAKLFLEVRQSNEAAISLYEKNGFITAGVRKRFYSEPREDALVMMKLL